MKSPSKTKQTTWVESLTVRRLAMLAVAWILLFAILYTVVPKFSKSAALRSSTGADVSDFGLSLYVSLATAVSLGYSDVYPTGLLRFLAGIEVLGGIVIAGLTMNTLVSQPSRETRKARRACEGWWVECCSLPKNRRFYSITFMTTDGGEIQKVGFNYDPGGQMADTYFKGQVVSTFFPMMMSLYENDKHSKDYTEGVYVFTMQLDNSGRYSSYLGSCYDAKHGRRDSIVGRKVTDAVSITLLNERTYTQKDLSKMVTDLFADLSHTLIPQPPPVHSDHIITVTKDAKQVPLDEHKDNP